MRAISMISVFVGVISITTILLIVNTSAIEYNQLNLVYAQSIDDPNLSISAEYQNLFRPIGMAFLDDSGKNIMVIEKTGDVKLIINGILQENPIKHFDVNFENERGLLGIEAMKADNSTLIFLYMTINAPELSGNSTETLRNRVYSFEWNGTHLVNQKVLLDLPASPGPEHNGGKITLGKDNNLYVVIGDLLFHKTKLQNVREGGDPDFTGTIFRIDPLNGKAPLDNPFINSGVPNTDRTFAYGIRNSFGLTVDPVTGTIWDTENGPDVHDEINIVEPGFNSGWGSIMGPSESPDKVKELVYISPNSTYSDPEISWLDTQALTDIEFINSSNLGENYTNNILVGDHNNGNLYFFKVNDNRSGLIVGDKLVDSKQENDSYVLGTGFISISDIETGPDGNIYVASLYGDKIYKIAPGPPAGWRAS